jgi:catechol 2,3-dioxygenase
MATSPNLPSDVRIGHVHLRVSDLSRSIAFYRDALGFTVKADGRDYGVPAAFLAAGNYHHHIALNTFESAGGTRPPAGHTGLYHVAILYPDRISLAAAVERLLAQDESFDYGRDHGGTLSVYLKDPDGNGIELYFDRPEHEWFDAQGRAILKNDPFDVDAFIAETNAAFATASRGRG